MCKAVSPAYNQADLCSDPDTAGSKVKFLCLGYFWMNPEIFASLPFTFKIFITRFKILLSHADLRTNTEKSPITIFLVFPDGIILQNCNIISQPGYWHWYSQVIEQRHHHENP